MGGGAKKALISEPEEVVTTVVCPQWMVERVHGDPVTRRWIEEIIKARDGEVGPYARGFTRHMQYMGVEPGQRVFIATGAYGEGQLEARGVPDPIACADDACTCGCHLRRFGFVHQCGILGVVGLRV